MRTRTASRLHDRRVRKSANLQMKSRGSSGTRRVWRDKRENLHVTPRRPCLRMFCILAGANGERDIVRGDRIRYERQSRGAAGPVVQSRSASESPGQNFGDRRPMRTRRRMM